MANSGFLTTDAGLAAAAVASPLGPFFHVTSFRVGAGVNYTPTRAQTTIQGATLYTGIPTSYSVIRDNQVEVVLTMQPDVGPFNYGEIGIYSGATLLAICVYDTFQQKLLASGPTAGSLVRIRARLTFAQAAAVVQVDTTVNQFLTEVPSWDSLQPPASQLSGANAVIVMDDSTAANQSALVIRESDTEWSFVNYHRVQTFAAASILNRTGTGFEIDKTEVNALWKRDQYMLLAHPGQYLIQFHGQAVRPLSAYNPYSFTNQVFSWITNLPVVPSQVSIWKQNVVSDKWAPGDTKTSFNALQNSEDWIEGIGQTITGASHPALAQALVPGALAATLITLPDMRGEFLRIADRGRGVDPGRLPNTTQASSVQAHTHGVNTYLSEDAGPFNQLIHGSPSASVQQYQTTSFGGAETRPRNISVYGYIKT